MGNNEMAAKGGESSVQQDQVLEITEQHDDSNNVIFMRKHQGIRASIFSPQKDKTFGVVDMHFSFILSSYSTYMSQNIFL